MIDFPLFQMASINRAILIEKHQFYVNQTKKKIFSQFNNIKKEALDEAKNILTLALPPNNFDEEIDICEIAEHYSEEIYDMLEDLKNNAILNGPS